ncbi:hypothetical protein METHP14_1000002 [Pseudomonas sp. P14-2025]
MDTLLQPVARTAARARAENFRTLFIVFPFKDFLLNSHLSGKRNWPAYIVPITCSK